MERDEYVPCPGCNDETFKVRRGEVCFDCAFPTKADRQFKFDRMRWELGTKRQELRDRLAMAAYPEAVNLATGDDNNSRAKWSPRLVGDWAYRLADGMLEARGPDAEPPLLLPETVDATK